MEAKNVKVLKQGDESGNGMVIKYTLDSGLEILGLPTKNFYGGHWDLGPTWNWLVMADKPFLVDSGRYGQGAVLAEMLAEYGVAPKDIDFVLVSHGHEDHDGGLAELVKLTNLRVKAHRVYARLIRKYPEFAPPDYKKDFPAKCWHCVMPESFWGKNCLGYHKVLQELEVDEIPDGRSEQAPGVDAIHLPGHSPDCLAVQLGDEAILVGDIVLPDISPWPTRVASYDEVAAVLPEDSEHPEEIFGLLRYIRSLKTLAGIAEKHTDILVLPAHRLFFHNKWKNFRLGERIEELLGHHRQRCAAIIEILAHGPKTAEEIAKEHFEEHLLKGLGSLMAANEIISHCELLTAAGDLSEIEQHKYETAGSSVFEGLI